MTNHNLKNYIKNITGAFLYGGGIACFLEPANIAPGGVSGISIMINFLTKLPIGVTTILINIPILLAGYIFLDKRLIKNTIFAVLLTSFIIDFIIAPLFPVYKGDRLLGSVFGGVLMGTGLGIIFGSGTTTGGTDILSLLLKRKFPQLRMGFAMLIIDCIILSFSILVFGDIESGLYGIISLFCSSKLIDFFLYSGDSATLVFIISKEYKKISSEILHSMNRGVTIIDATGAYSQKQNKIIMCVVRKQEFPLLKQITLKADGTAFLTAAISESVSGEGFYRNTPF